MPCLGFKSQILAQVVKQGFFGEAELEGRADEGLVIVEHLIVGKDVWALSSHSSPISLWLLSDHG